MIPTEVACTQMSFGVQMTPRGRVHTLDYSVSLEVAAGQKKQLRIVRQRRSEAAVPDSQAAPVRRNSSG